MTQLIQQSELPRISESTFQNVLMTHGWKAEDGAAIATKEYQTAVGVKTAFAYLSSGPNYYWLKGNYESRGNNILSTTWLLIEEVLSDIELEEAIHDFAMQCDAIIADSYAVRLLRHAATHTTFKQSQVASTFND